MLFIQNSRVIDPKTGTDAVRELIIEDGKIVDMGENLAERCQALASENGSSLQILDGKGLITAPGLIDVHVHFRDPGFTYKEDIQTGARAAAAGGFTTVICMANTVPLIVPLRFPQDDPSLITNNGINRGAVSAELGIGGSPAAAEDVMVARDCMLAIHTGATVDIQHISSGRSVRMVELAKQLGAHVMAEVTPHHFSLDESAVLKHGSLAKMNPPLRTLEDKQEILRGLKEGIIDIIATDHAPHSAEEKGRPLTQAPSGIIGLETALSLGITNLVDTGCLTMVQLMEKMSLNPAILYRLEEHKGWIGKGADADLVIFDPDASWTVENFQSKSSNSPFVGETLKGVVKYTVCGGEIAWENPAE